MKRETWAINFYCRSSKTNRKGLAPIEMSLVMNSERAFVTLPRKMLPKDFEKDMKQRKNNDTKDFCSLWEQKANTSVAELMRADKPLTVHSIKNAMLNGVKTTTLLSELFKEHLSLMAEKTKSGLTLGSYRKYERSFESFIKAIGDKDVNEVKPSDVERFVALEKGTKQWETVRGECMRVKSAFLKFDADGKLKANPWKSIKLPHPRQKIEILTEEEYNKIRDKRFDIPRLERVRQLFVLGCNTGLSYCDMMDLSLEDIKTKDGIDFIEKPRRKTGVTFTAVILDDGKEILRNTDIDSLKLSNQRLNGFLKEVQDLCGIHHTLTFHKSRHYYCTRLLRKGINPTIVQRCLGHSKLTMTMHYTHLVQSDILNAFR